MDDMKGRKRRETESEKETKADIQGGERREKIKISLREEGVVNTSSKVL